MKKSAQKISYPLIFELAKEFEVKMETGGFEPGMPLPPGHEPPPIIPLQPAMPDMWGASTSTRSKQKTDKKNDSYADDID